MGLCLQREVISGSVWALALELARDFLILIAFTRLALLLYLKKLQLSGLRTLLRGAVLAGLLTKLALK